MSSTNPPNPRKRIAVNEAMVLVRCLRANADSIKSYTDFVASGHGSVEELEKLTKGWVETLTKIQNANRRWKRPTE